MSLVEEGKDLKVTRLPISQGSPVPQRKITSTDDRKSSPAESELLRKNKELEVQLSEVKHALSIRTSELKEGL